MDKSNRTYSLADFMSGSPAERLRRAERRVALLTFELKALAQRTPVGAGWVRLSDLLEDASHDDQIQRSMPAADFLRQVHRLVDDALMADSAAEALAPIGKRAVSESSRDKARRKNLDARTWVQGQWDSRTDLGQSKASFARTHAALVYRRFRKKVTPETISDRWLKDRA